MSVADWVTIRNMQTRNPKKGTRTIAKELGLSRNTVRNALRSDEAPEYKRKEVVSPELEDYTDYIHLHYTIKGLKGSRILSDLRTQGCTVSQSAFYRYLKKLNVKKSRSYMRYETAPGEQGQFDWSPYKVLIAGILTTVQVYSLILGCSRYRKYFASLRQTQSSVFEAYEDCLIRLGGVPKRVQSDNHSTMRNVNTDEWNKKYLLFCDHYGFSPSRSAPRRPWSKGKVEAPFSFLDTHFIAGNEFSSFEDFARRLSDFEDFVNKRVHDTTRVAPEALFLKEEKDCLLPLPETKFIGTKEIFRKVSSDCLISYEGNRYSVPHSFSCQSVWVRVCQGHYLDIYSRKNILISRHTLERNLKGQFFMKKEHFQGYRGTTGTWEVLSKRFLDRCPDHSEFLEKLKSEKRINPRRHLTMIVESLGHFSSEDIENVIEQCDRYNVYKGDVFVELLHQQSGIMTVNRTNTYREIDVGSPSGVIRELDYYKTVALSTCQE